HLFDLAGFRCTPGSRGERDKVVHVNVYTTDKTVTYQLHNGSFSPHRVSSLYPGNIRRLLEDMNTIATTFSQCGGSAGTVQDGTARFELRVNLDQALEAITSFPDELIRRSAVCIPSPIWWDFKFCRVAAIHYVLAELANDPPQSRVLIPSLTLGAVLIYMLNAVISRPGEWRADRALAEAGAMLVLN
ncbi:hypothetical protein BV20DRAFT_919007, partial [Pilatotrama ljubarskyi]